MEPNNKARRHKEILGMTEKEKKEYKLYGKVLNENERKQVESNHKFMYEKPQGRRLLKGNNSFNH